MSGSHVPSSQDVTSNNAMNNPQNNPQSTIRTKEHQKRSYVVEKHLHWLKNHECKLNWLPTASESEKTIEDINWGQLSVPSKQAELMNPALWDEIGSQAFKSALQRQEHFSKGITGSKDLSHTELDVQGLDANGARVRVQRTLEVTLKISTEASDEGKIEKSTLKLDRLIIISSPPAFSLPPNKPRDREPYHALLEQLAQHEVNKAFDERNHFLRELFGQDVDHVRKYRPSTIADQEWSCQRPELCIRGLDGTVISLKEKRTDSAVGDEVVLMHTIEMQQVRGGGRSHLFDMPAEGSESERRIRQARWTISSAIDRCLAEGSAERFVLEKWVDDTFLPRS